MTVKLDDLLCYKLFKVVKLNEHLIDKGMEHLQLSRTQWKIMARFNFLNIPCAQQEMLTSMGIDRAHLTRSLEKLEARKLINRERLDSDKRAYTIAPTTKGQQLVKQIERILKNESALLISGISEKENNCLKKALIKIELNILDELNKLTKK